MTRTYLIPSTLGRYHSTMLTVEMQGMWNVGYVDAQATRNYMGGDVDARMRKVEAPHPGLALPLSTFHLGTSSCTLGSHSIVAETGRRLLSARQI